MAKLFGQNETSETALLNRTLAVLTLSVSLKIVGIVLLIVLDRIGDINGYSHGSVFTGVSLCFWIFTEMVPCVHLFRSHYLNFISLEGHEYLVTEYPDTASEISQSIQFSSESEL